MGESLSIPEITNFIGKKTEKSLYEQSLVIIESKGEAKAGNVGIRRMKVSVNLCRSVTDSSGGRICLCR